MASIQSILETPTRVVVCEDPMWSATDGAEEFKDYSVEETEEGGVLFEGIYTEFVGHPGYATPDVYQTTLRILYVPNGTKIPKHQESNGKQSRLIEAGG